MLGISNWISGLFKIRALSRSRLGQGNQEQWSSPKCVSRQFRESRAYLARVLTPLPPPNWRGSFWAEAALQGAPRERDETLSHSLRLMLIGPTLLGLWRAFIFIIIYKLLIKFFLKKIPFSHNRKISTSKIFLMQISRSLPIIPHINVNFFSFANFNF